MTGVRFTSPDPTEREAQLRTALAYIEIAYALVSPTIRIYGGPIAPYQEEHSTMEWIIDGFRKTADLSARRGILVLLETHDSFSTGAKARRFIEAVSHPRIAVVWDFLHSCRFGEALEATWAEIGPWVKDVHVKDSSWFAAEGFDLKLPGNGNRYNGWHPVLEEPEAALPHYITYMNELLKEIGWLLPQ